MLQLARLGLLNARNRCGVGVQVDKSAKQTRPHVDRFPSQGQDIVPALRQGDEFATESLRIVLNFRLWNRDRAATARIARKRSSIRF